MFLFDLVFTIHGDISVDWSGFDNATDRNSKCQFIRLFDQVFVVIMVLLGMIILNDYDFHGLEIARL